MISKSAQILLFTVAIVCGINQSTTVMAIQGGLVANDKTKTSQAQQSDPAAKATTPDDTAANAVSSPPESIGVTFSNPVQAKWKVGVRVVGGAKSVRNMLITIPVPNQWPEQSVSISSEEIPSNVGDVNFRDLESGVKQMVLTLPDVRAGEETIATMTFLVSTSQISAPGDTTIFVRPKSNNKQAKMYLGVSPAINYRDSKLRQQVKELVTDKPTVWEETRSIFEWIGDNLEQRDAEPSNIEDVFKAKSGCAEDRVALFVGMCRANKVPARMVWVEGTQYAEFMLADAEGNPHWFPCSVNGIREFGSLSDPRIILQKGESIRVPEKDDRQKFVAEFAAVSGAAKPSVKFIRQLLPANQ